METARLVAVLQFAVVRAVSLAVCLWKHLPVVYLGVMFQFALAAVLAVEALC